MRRGFGIPALLALTCIAPAAARASWPTDGVLLSDSYLGFASGGLPQFAHLSTGPSGSVLAAAGAGGGNGQQWFVQRVLADGTLAPGWPTGGIASGGAFLSNGVGVHGFSVDAAGTWWHAWRDDNLRLEAVHPDGSIGPGPAQAVGHEPESPVHPRLADDGGGGVYLANYASGIGRIRIQRRLADGSMAPVWNPRGRLLSGFAGEFCHLLPDGEGGVVIVWPFVDFQAGGYRMRALRLAADTTTAPGWLEGGLALGTSGVDPVTGGRPPCEMLLRSGPDHMIAGWTHTPAAGDVHVYLQRFGLDGALDPGWPASGLEVVTPGDLRCVTLVPDGSGGVHVLWEAAGVPLTTHVSASGQYVAGHDASGVALVDAAADHRPQTSANWGNHAVDRLAGATGMDGGLVFAWPDFRTGQPEARVRWLLANGTPDPNEPAAGRVVSPPGIGNVNDALADGAGGAYVSWWQCNQESGCLVLETRLTRAERSATLGVDPPEGAGAPSLVLRAPFPNPARGEVRFHSVLPEDGPAVLHLFDVSGRVVRVAELGGKGEHVVRFGDLGSLAPGLHFARLSQGPARRVTRVVVAP